MKKVTFLALHLSYGGIEKCICDAANLLCNDYDVEILTTYKMIDKIPFKLSNKVKVTYLTSIKPNQKEFYNALKHFRLIKAFKEGLKGLKGLSIKKNTMIEALKNSNSDIYISTRDYFNKLLGKYGKNIKIGWEHNHHHNNKKYIKNLTKSCKNLDNLILVSKDLYKYYDNLFKSKNMKCKCVLIPNSIDEVPAKENKIGKINLISVGRLSKEKGYLTLIDVFNEIHKINKDIKLNIVGDGKEYTLIKEKINKYKLNDSVILHGFQKPDYINELYKDSAIYLMTSYTESFGLVLVEAMSSSLVPIAFDCAEGPREIIKNNYNGYLIKNRDINKMANKVIEVINDVKLLKELSNNAYNTSKEYLNTNFKDKWIKLIERK